MFVLEIIELSGYSEPEKIAIAQNYLLPRQLEKAGLPLKSSGSPPRNGEGLGEGSHPSLICQRYL
ncbi:hypothetical protein H6F97_16860 [Microcoleus sp. FACHB-1]|nr:hypothetical protein [Microcoleus sp. FACHB-1]